MLIYNIQIIPAIIPFAKAQTTTEITMILQGIIQDAVKSNDYNNFVKLNYKENGEVVSLETNTANISTTTSIITKNAISKLCTKERLTVSIPLGTLSGDAFFIGRGPDINIKLAVSKKITTNIENEFFECGINQTLHRIIACIETEVYILLPFSPQKINVSTECCIAETIIVGKVPDAYTKINRVDDELAESDIDDIYDFGATLN